jgi:hypothetical protein
VSVLADSVATRGDTVPEPHWSSSSEGYSKAKCLALAFSLIIVLVVLSPIAQNWQLDPRDNFPLSYYPMFSYERSGPEELSYLVGMDLRGNRVPIPYTLAGSGGMNQVRRQINKYVSRNEADHLCQLVGKNLAQRRSEALSRIAWVQVVTGQYELGQYYSGDKAPLSERVRAYCPVVRRA